MTQPHLSSVTALALLLIGFSLFSSITLTITHFRQENYQGQRFSQAMGILLLLALSWLQLAHFVWLYGDLPWVVSVAYRTTLFIVAPAFYLFSRPLLTPQDGMALRPTHFIHVIPIVCAPFLPPAAALPLAFLVGAGYLAWLARSLYALRLERTRFRLEMLLLGGVFAIAIGVSFLGLAQSTVPGKPFFALYSIAIGSAFVLVQITLGLRPRLSQEVGETAQAAYAHSTLGKVDCDKALANLETLMCSDQLFRDPDLSLPILAERLALTSHQLSELLNARLGKGFARYLREQRVAAACAMLCAEPSASVLSVGLNVGFTAQSNFYEAFREIEGTTPGQFRKLRCGSTGT